MRYRISANYVPRYGDEHVDVLVVTDDIRLAVAMLEIIFAHGSTTDDFDRAWIYDTQTETIL